MEHQHWLRLWSDNSLQLSWSNYTQHHLSWVVVKLAKLCRTHSNPTASTHLSTSQRDNDGQRSKDSNAKKNNAHNQLQGDEIKALLSNIALWRGRGQALFTLTTGGVGGTTGIIGAAGGGGAAAGGAVTGGTLAVMVGTGVAAMTGVWDTAGGTLWNGAGGETEDTATACCVPFKRQNENTLWCTDSYKCWQDMGNKVTLMLLYWAVTGLANRPQLKATGRAQRTLSEICLVLLLRVQHELENQSLT